MFFLKTFTLKCIPVTSVFLNACNMRSASSDVVYNAFPFVNNAIVYYKFVLSSLDLLFHMGLFAHAEFKLNDSCFLKPYVHLRANRFLRVFSVAMEEKLLILYKQRAPFQSFFLDSLQKVFCWLVTPSNFQKSLGFPFFVKYQR